MGIEDLLVPRECKKYIDELEHLCKEHNLETRTVLGRRRRYPLIEGKSKAIVAFFTTPKPERKVNNIAWNKIDEGDSFNLKDYHGTTWNNKRIRCLVFQEWKNEDSLVVIPLDELNRIPEFNKRGHFHVKKDSDGFWLITPKWDDNIRLKEGIDKVLDYL